MITSPTGRLIQCVRVKIRAGEKWPILLRALWTVVLSESASIGVHRRLHWLCVLPGYGLAFAGTRAGSAAPRIGIGRICLDAELRRMYNAGLTRREGDESVMFEV